MIEQGAYRFLTPTPKLFENGLDIADVIEIEHPTEHGIVMSRESLQRGPLCPSTSEGGGALVCLPAFSISVSGN